MDLGLRGRTAIVGGSSRGLGLAVAHRLILEGANVTICGRDADSLARAQVELGEVSEDPGKIHAVPLDLAEPGQPARLVEETLENFGSLDIVVPNAGGPPNGGALAVGADRLRWGTAFASNFWSSLELTDAALPHLLDQGWGRVCMIGSRTVKEPDPGLVLSNTTRSALWSWAKSLATEVADKGVTVTMAMPGLHNTARVAQRMTSEGLEIRLRAIPVGRLGKPEEFASLVAFLCSEHAAFITGTTVMADGGESQAY